MPCGGIYPISHDKGLEPVCFLCGELIQPDSPMSFCEEWDCHLHDDCIDAFLDTDEGRCVIEHGHDIIRRDELD